ncbi:hypothetical protein [Verrucomicrobium spinosum]|uniref:hypothetical protein n=1 Tax=Verrucomicrobium spinosum TaxID=2736 RepID=UPI0012E0D70C|nr:hypothetical protein [Verrucomicrobium spinosum]
MKLVSRSDTDEDLIFELAKRHWRDLFETTGFGNSADEHNRRYRDLFQDAPDCLDVTPKRWWAFWRK